MSRDYYTCAGCGSGFADDNGGEAAWCECESSFCYEECGKFKNFSREEPGEEITDDDPRFLAWEEGNYRIDLDLPITCVICRKEKYTQENLFQALLKHYNLTHKDAVKIWRNQK